MHFIRQLLNLQQGKRPRSLSCVAQSNNLRMCLAVNLFATQYLILFSLWQKGSAGRYCTQYKLNNYICNELVHRTQQNHRKLVRDYPSTEITPSD